MSEPREVECLVCRKRRRKMQVLEVIFEDLSISYVCRNCTGKFDFTSDEIISIDQPH